MLQNAPSAVNGSRLVFSPDGLRLAGALKDRSDETQTSVLRIWDAATGKVVLNREWPFDFIGGPAYNADGTLLATAIGEWWGPSAVKVLDAVSGKELHSLAGHRHRVEELVFSPDGRRLASAASTLAGFLHPDGKAEVKLWDVAGGRELLSLPATGAGSLAFSPDGRRLIYVSAVYKKGAEVQVWDATPLPEERAEAPRKP